MTGTVTPMSALKMSATWTNSPRPKAPAPTRSWLRPKTITPEENKMQVPKNLQKIPWLVAGYHELGVGRYGSVGAHGNAVPAQDNEGHIRNNPRILEYFAATAQKKRGEWTESNSWCSAFVNWCMRQSGIVGTHSAMARSWLHWHNGEKLDQPRIGAVVVFPRPPDPEQG